MNSAPPAPSPPLVLRALGRLPLAGVRAAGALFGWLVYAASPRYRRLLRENLAQAGVDDARLRSQAVQEAGRMVAELPWVWARAPQAVAARVACDRLDLVAPQGDGRGILFLTAHLGAFEVAARYCAAHRPITVLYRPAKRARVDRWVRAARDVTGVRPVPANRAGVRALLRALRDGEAVGLLPDQVPSVGEGRWVPFFGRPAYTMTLPQRLAQASGARVVLAAVERLPGEGWRIHLEQIDEEPTPEAINRRIEALVRRWPALYLWAYNRYKHPAGAPPAPGNG